MIIPYGRQSIDDDDIQAVTEVLRSDWLTQGPSVPAFEAALAAYCGVPHCIAVNSATSALHIACQALGIGQGDIVWTSPNSFVASANCAKYLGADVDFVDISLATGNLCPHQLERKLIQAKAENRLPKVVIPVHFAGQSCDMRAIHALSQTYGFAIIEDASHAIGGAYCGSKVGGCHFSDMTVFSFHPVKVMTTGEGGAITTRDPQLAATLEKLRSHGITRDPSEMTIPAHGPWYYQQQTLGYNYRLTDIQAALGLSQLGKLDTFITERNRLARQYDSLLRDLPITALQQSDDCLNAYHLYIVNINDAQPEQRADVFSQLREAGIGVNVHYIPIHLQPYYQKMGYKQGDFPNAEAYYQSALTLPLYPRLTDEQQQYVVDVLSKLL